MLIVKRRYKFKNYRMAKKARPYYEGVVARNIKKALRNNNMKQKDLAEKLNMQEQQLSDKLTGKTTCLDLLPFVSKYFDIPEMFFFLESNDDVKSPEEARMYNILKDKGITEAKVLEYVLSGDLLKLEEAIGMDNIINLSKLLGKKDKTAALNK